MDDLTKWVLGIFGVLFGAVLIALARFVRDADLNRIDGQILLLAQNIENLRESSKQTADITAFNSSGIAALRELVGVMNSEVSGLHASFSKHASKLDSLTSGLNAIVISQSHIEGQINSFHEAIERRHNMRGAD